MNIFNGKTALISGGAEGIGFALATALGRQGMNIVIGDIDQTTLANAQAKLEAEGIAVLAELMDVTDLLQWQAIAAKAVERFGSIHMLINNAGVASSVGPIESTDNKDWRWLIDVNLMGVVNGTQTIVPLIKQHGEGGWLINVSSMAGMGGVPFGGAYTATKVAVVAMSESWRVELAPDNIKVAVLCPAFVKTRVHLSERNRPEDLKNTTASQTKEQGNNIGKKLVENGIPTELVADRVIEALQQNEFYIFTHPNYKQQISRRNAALEQAFDRAAKSPLLSHLLDEDIPGFS